MQEDQRKQRQGAYMRYNDTSLKKYILYLLWKTIASTLIRCRFKKKCDRFPILANAGEDAMFKGGLGAYCRWDFFI